MFQKTILNLSGISSKSIKEPKVQETPTVQILRCLFKNNVVKHNCNNSKKSQMDTKIEINKNPIHIIKPQTFMNESGVAVNEVSKFFKIKQENIIVVYDDLDLPIGNLKIKVGGGSAGHNGIKSIEKYIETNKIIKIRVGIGKPVNKGQINSHVLSKFTQNENILLKPILEKFEQIIEDIVLEGISFAMNKFNSKIQ